MKVGFAINNTRLIRQYQTFSGVFVCGVPVMEQQWLLQARIRGTIPTPYRASPQRSPSSGGGAFGNRAESIIAAMQRAFHRLAETGIDVRIVHYAGVHECFRDLERPPPRLFSRSARDA